MKPRSIVLACSIFLTLSLAASAQVEFSVGWAPPPLPVVVQPPCPVAGYIWTPGYWGWNADYYDYYWVPGAWVPPPRVGLLWTPGWWGWNNGAYAFNQGYWGPTVGFYGGINYGYGYTGNGYWGGRWNGNTFQYNTAVTRVNKTVIHNTYVNNSFARNVNANRTSFNGGNRGIKAEPNAEQRKAMANANKVGPTTQQLNRQRAAAKDKNFLASTNKGKPNQDAIRSFNKNEGIGQGKGAQEVGAAGGAAGAGNKLGAHQGQGAGMGGEEHGKKGGIENAGNKHGAENVHRNERHFEANQAKAHMNKGAEHGGPAYRSHGMNQMSHNPQMGARHPQMGGKHPNMGGGHPPKGGGNRPHPGGQPQGKKKPGKP